MGTEIVPLGLQQVGRKTFGTVAVKPGEGCREGWCGDAVEGRGRNHTAQALLACIEDIHEIGVHDEVVQVALFLERLAYLVQECRPDDASASPHKCNAAQVQIPVVGRSNTFYQGEALGVGDDLCSIEGLAQLINKGFFIMGKFNCLAGENLACGNSLLFLAAYTPGKDRLNDQGEGYASVEC